MNKLFILVIVLTIFIFIFIFYSRPVSKAGFVTNVSIERSENPLFIYEIIKYPSNVEIIQTEPNKSVLVGITADPWNINFGILHPSYGGKRIINIANYKDQPYHVRLVVYGNISSMVSFSKDDLVLHKGDEVQISVLLNTSSSTKPGNYTGEIDVISEGTKIPFLGKILRWY